MAAEIARHGERIISRYQTGHKGSDGAAQVPLVTEPITLAAPNPASRKATRA